jgi:hypothetical protein
MSLDLVLMPHQLKMIVTMKSRGEEHGKPIRYRVTGMPVGEEGTISQPPHSQWQFRRTKDGVVGEWTGDFDTAEEALAALQSEVNESSGS